MAVITRRFPVVERIECSTYYKLDTAHDVVCLDFKTQDEGGLGHMSMHIQLSRVAVQELINALTDTLEGIVIDAPFPGEAGYEIERDLNDE